MNDKKITGKQVRDALGNMLEREIQKTDEQLFCSFCGKEESDVEKLIAGAAVFICNECVANCAKILRDDGIELDY